MIFEGIDHRDGVKAGLHEGKELGLQKGWEIGQEVGFYAGCIQVPKLCKLQKGLRFTTITYSIQHTTTFSKRATACELHCLLWCQAITVCHAVDFVKQLPSHAEHTCVLAQR